MGELSAANPAEKTGFEVGLVDDGAAAIKAHPWLRAIDWDRMLMFELRRYMLRTSILVQDLHLQRAPYQPNLHNEADTRHFEDGIADEVWPAQIDNCKRSAKPCQPLVAAGAPPVDATRDPMLADRKHGGHLLELRKG